MICFYGLGQFFSFFTMLKVKIPTFLPKQKSMCQIFYMLHSTYICIRKSLKSWKNVGGKVGHYCLGPKIRLGYCDPHFNLSSKISLVGSAFWLEVLILEWNRNCAPKFLFRDLVIFRHPHSSMFGHQIFD